MEISLIRHGKSLLTENEKLTLKEFKSWVEKYDNYGVHEESTYPTKTMDRIANANLVVTSDLKRAVHSAKLLNPKAKIISKPLFRETELPAHSKNLFNVKYRPNAWAVILRILWLCGYSNECESISEAKCRAKEIIDYAEEHQSIVVVGHGFFNRFLAKELQNKGWKGKRKTGTKHWGCTTYSFH